MSWSSLVTSCLSLAMSVVVVGEVPAREGTGIPEKRLAWTDSRVEGSPDALLPFKTARAFAGVSVTQPLLMAPEPGTNRLLVMEHLQYWAGPSRLIAMEDRNDVSTSVKLLDLDGLAVSVAFHPDYINNGYLFIGLTGPGPDKQPRLTQAVRYTVNKKTGLIDPSSKLFIVGWPSFGHDGAAVAFGNDGYLYVTAGDGSSDSDARLTGQDITDFQGSVIRIDVDHPADGKPYSVPKDNPFVSRKGAQPELWCYGLRNPWRMSFDRESGQLWVGNNGQDLWEQVYLIQKGANYGWSVVEGGHPFRAQRQQGPDPIQPPTADHSHSEARSLTGGLVYRGKQFPELIGAYIYGDWSTGRVWGIKHDGEKVLWHKLLVDTPFNITGFGSDHAGEVYVIDEVSGFYGLEATTDADKPKRPFPTRLSETGMFESVAPLRLNQAAFPYEVSAPQWADGARMERAIAIPGLEKIELKSQKNAGGAWTFPNGTVISQTLTVDVVGRSGQPTPRKVETRLMTRQQGQWVGYSYRWNAEQTDAELVGDSGDSEELQVVDPKAPGGTREQNWRFPSRSECLACHSRASGFVLGFTPTQLDRPGIQAGKKVENQLDALEHLGIFEAKLGERRPNRQHLVDPYDRSAKLESRVKSYLSVNCSICHVKEGGGNSKLELGLDTPLTRANLIDEPPVHSDLGLPNARVIAPGAPERSVLHHRLSNRGGFQMPPLVSNEVDRQAVEMIAEWIRSLPPPKK